MVLEFEIKKGKRLCISIILGNVLFQKKESRLVIHEPRVRQFAYVVYIRTLELQVRTRD